MTDVNLSEWVTSTGSATAHLPWKTRGGYTLTWCLDVCRPTVQLRERQDGDGMCRACLDASQQVTT